ncbi:MAG: metal-dependent hydrolase [Subtercola sp.]|nr:metal-dependent hydrolase [Subtercola sp.]
MSSAPRSAAPRIDAHLHLWSRGRSEYAWITPGAGVLYDDFTPERAEPELAAAGMSHAVLIQADDSRADTEFMLEVAAGHPWVAGVVGWVDLTDPASAEQELDLYSELPVFSGVRALLHTDERDGMLERDDVRRTLALLAERGLAFDVPNAWPRHLDSVSPLAEALPDLHIVIDHLASPPATRGDEFEAWRRALAQAAARPNTVAKVSGLQESVGALSPSALAEIWDIALELFTPNRLMFGSDWPMTLSRGGYQPVVAAIDELAATLSTAEADELFSGTANRVYRLTLDGADLDGTNT